MTLIRALEIFHLTSLDELDPESLKSLYKQLAKIHHPDKPGGNNQVFMSVQEAYNVLLIQLRKMGVRGRKMNKLDITVYTRQLEAQISILKEQMQHTLESTQNQVQEALEDFEQNKNSLQEDIQNTLEKLRRESKPTFWQQLFGDKNGQLLKEQEDIVWQEFERIHQKIYNQLLEKISILYGKTLNRVASIVGIEDKEFEQTEGQKNSENK